jgi:uncharacterized protein (DUF1501 family)
MKEVSRREFLKQGLGFVTVSLSIPSVLALAGKAANFAPRQAGKSKILVLVQMNGGNDGLNTVIPYEDGAYYKARPTISIAADKVLRLDTKTGLHNDMTGFAQLFKDKNLAIVQGVGYPTPNRSHFRSIEIWQTGCPERIESTGWIGRYLDCCATGSSAAAGVPLFPAVNVDPILPKSLLADRVTVPSVNNPMEFQFRTDPLYTQDRKAQVQAFNEIYADFDLKRPHADLLRKAGVDANAASDYLQQLVKSYKGVVKYPTGNFGNGLKFIAQMIAGGLNAPVFACSLDGFDTHTNQSRQQAGLLKQLSEGVFAFFDDLKTHKVDEDVVVLAFSEFGRRVAENGGKGTDHGTAAPALVIGTSVKGGIYGDQPSLTNLDNGDLKYGIDFRSIYATILDKWLTADSKSILGSTCEYVPFL